MELETRAVEGTAQGKYGFLNGAALETKIKKGKYEYKIVSEIRLGRTYPHDDLYGGHCIDIMYTEIYLINFKGKSTNFLEKIISEFFKKTKKGDERDILLEYCEKRPYEFKEEKEIPKIKFEIKHEEIAQMVAKYNDYVQHLHNKNKNSICYMDELNELIRSMIR